MCIFSRLSDIINANIVHMLDKAENPEKMVRLIVQEMEDTLVEVKSSAAKFIADKKTMERQIDQIRESQNSWQQKAELAVSHNRDDLAKMALAEKAKKAEVLAVFEKELVTVQTTIEKFRADIHTLEEKLVEAKKRQKTIVMRRHAASQQLQMRRQVERNDAIHTAQKFEQFERSLDRIEGEVDAFDLKRNPVADELTQLENQTQLEKELAALKEKMNVPSRS